MTPVPFLFDQDLVGVVTGHQAAVVEEAGLLDLGHRELAEFPRRRPVADRPLAHLLGQQLQRLVEQPLLFGLVVQGRQPFVDPAVDADLVHLLLEDARHHLRVQRGAHRRDEERRRHLLAIEHPQDPRQAVDRAVLAARQHLVVEVALRQRHRGVVDVERQRHGDAVVARPRRRLQPAPGADVEHLAFELFHRLGDAGQRVGPLGRRWRGRRRLGLAGLSAAGSDERGNEEPRGSKQR